MNKFVPKLRVTFLDLFIMAAKKIKKRLQST